MVTFETKCYENDWEFILKGNRLNDMIARCRFNFARKVVIINNVRDVAKVSRYAEKKVNQGIIDGFYVAADHAAAALDFFELDKDAFKGGYYYSIAELVGIYVCETEFLLHFSSDAMPSADGVWIDEALEIFAQRPDIAVANATWDHRFDEAAQEAFESIGNFYLGRGFSDQCYLIRTADFRKPVYNETHAASDRYPAYGGELFEKRVDSHMQRNDLLRITSKTAAYEHRNFPKGKLDRLQFKLNMYFNRSSSKP